MCVCAMRAHHFQPHNLAVGPGSSSSSRLRSSPLRAAVLGLLSVAYGAWMALTHRHAAEALRSQMQIQGVQHWRMQMPHNMLPRNCVLAKRQTLRSVPPVEVLLGQRAPLILARETAAWARCVDHLRGQRRMMEWLRLVCFGPHRR